jgi:hypothetical protein
MPLEPKKRRQDNGGDRNIYNFNLGVTLYFGAVRKCAGEIFYLKKFLLAC